MDIINILDNKNKRGNNPKLSRKHHIKNQNHVEGYFKNK